MGKTWNAEEFAQACESVAASIRARSVSREIVPCARFYLCEWYAILKDVLCTEQGLAHREGASPLPKRAERNNQSVAGLAGVHKCSGGLR
jgi:hypothetical protein